MTNGIFDLVALTSPNRDSGPHPVMTSPLEARHKRRPLGPLTSLANSFELGAVKSKICKSTHSLSKSMSLMKFPDFPMFGHDDTDEDEGDDENDTTLNDEDLLSSPTLKSKAGANCRTQSLFTPLAPLDIQSNNNDNFQHLDNLAASGIHTFKVSNDLIPRINDSEMVNILAGKYTDLFDEILIIDCRFPYEFDGGHIVDAINIASQTNLEEHFVLRNEQSLENGRKLLIFHCEYSIFRGPTMASHLRKMDRLYNSDRYPYLLYPDIVVLEGGYKRFFDKHKHHCFPQAYVEMRDNKHKRTCEVEMSKVLQASKLTRAKSFNQFQPRLSTSHARSSSFTAILSSSEQNFTLTTTTPYLRKSRSSKIHKRERRDTKLLFTQSLLSLPNSMDSPKVDSPVSSTFEDDFAPPPALFRSHSKSLSNLLISVNSSLLLVCSESFSAFSSSDSLLESNSPFADCYDYFDGVPTKNSGNLLSGGSKIGFSFPNSSVHGQQQSGSGTPYNGQTTKNKARLTLARPNVRPTQHMAISSPTISSPLTGLPSSTFESASYSNSLPLDVINDTPVEFSLPLKHTYHDLKRLLSFSTGHTLDIDEAAEESD